MPTDVLRILELALVALVYLFFFRVVRAVWAELRAPRPALRIAPPAIPAPTGVPGAAPAVAPSVVLAAPTPVAAVPRTLWLTGPAADAGRRIPLQGTLAVGRAPSSEVLLNDLSVSAVHARLLHTGAEVLLEDLGSRNGTTLDGRRITGPLPVVVGQEVGFGAVTAVLE